MINGLKEFFWMNSINPIYTITIINSLKTDTTVLMSDVNSDK